MAPTVSTKRRKLDNFLAVAAATNTTKSSSSNDLSLTAVLEISQAESAKPLLLHILSFLTDAEDLARTGQVCHAFCKAASLTAKKETERLIGKVKKIHGQSIQQQLWAAQHLRDADREKLHQWGTTMDDTDPRYEVGVICTKDNCYEDMANRFPFVFSDQLSVVMATVPSQLSPRAAVPAALWFHSERFLRDDRIRCRPALVNLPSGFFHMNIDPEGILFVLRKNQRRYQSDATLEDVLNSLAADIEDTDTRHARPDAALRVFNYGSMALYRTYLEHCIELFNGYRLGYPIPSLRILSLAVENLVGNGNPDDQGS